MSWVAAAVVGSAVVGGVASSRAAGKASDAQSAAGDAAIAEQQRQFDTLLGMTSNQRAIGNQALNALGGVYGYAPAPGFGNDEYSASGGLGGPRSLQPVIVGDAELPPGAIAENPGGESDIYYNGRLIGHVRRGGPNGRFSLAPGVTLEDVWGQWEQEQASQSRQGNAFADPSAPDYSAFFKSPDYQFRMNEGMKTVQNSAAAQGGLYSGNALRGITEYGQGLAAGEFGNWFNRQGALAGIGQTATSQAGNAAMQTGANVGNLMAMQGDARASGIIGQSNALSNTFNQLGTFAGLYKGGYFDKGPASSPYSPMALNYRGPSYGGGLA